jgi:O-antigen/teichoic acid export membrane protein
VVGIYFLAFSLSVQPIMLLSGNVANMLFPVLSRLQDEAERQRAAFLRSIRVLAVFALPLSAAISALASPVIVALYGQKWTGSIILLRILSLGMAVRCLGWVAGSFLQARGRFGALAVARSIWCALFFASGIWAVRHGLTAFAIAVSLMHAYDSVINLVMALGWSRESFSSLAKVVRVPVAASVVSWVAVYGLSSQWPSSGPWLLAQIAFGLAVFAAVTAGSVWLADRGLFREILDLRKSLFPSRGGRREAQGGFG